MENLKVGQVRISFAFDNNTINSLGKAHTLLAAVVYGSVPRRFSLELEKVNKYKISLGVGRSAEDGAVVDEGERNSFNCLRVGFICIQIELARQ